MKSKKCFKCSQVLPISEFYPHPQMGDGHLGKCKECAKRDARNHREANIEEAREYDRKRFRDKRRKATVATYQRRMRAAYPEKYIARNALSNAIRDGRVNRPDRCSECGRMCKPQGHHADYSKPLDVMWLCRSCHGKLHGWYKERA